MILQLFSSSPVIMIDRPLNVLVAFAFFLVALTIAFYYFLSAEVMTRLYKTEIDPSKIYLSFGGVFCQESHILDEWIKHHLAEGVQHFFLIDNCNTAKDQAVLKPYVDEGIVTLMINTTKYAQIELYKYVLVPAAMGKTEWLIVGDLDEFYYAPFQSTIPAVIKNNFEHCPAITIPEIKFGSSGNNATPPSIVDANIMRINYDTHEADVRAHCKVIIRMSHLKRIAIHSHEYKQDQLSCLAFENNYYMTTRTAGGTYPLRELDLQKLVIRYNHYAVQSREYFFGVKATRGDVHHEDRNHYRDDNYFKRADYNEIIDLTLKNKKKKRPIKAYTGKITAITDEAS